MNGTAKHRIAFVPVSTALHRCHCSDWSHDALGTFALHSRFMGFWRFNDWWTTRTSRNSFFLMKPYLFPLSPLVSNTCKLRWAYRCIWTLLLIQWSTPPFKYVTIRICSIRNDMLRLFDHICCKSKATYERSSDAQPYSIVTNFPLARIMQPNLLSI